MSAIGFVPMGVKPLKNQSGIDVYTYNPNNPGSYSLGTSWQNVAELGSTDRKVIVAVKGYISGAGSWIMLAETEKEFLGCHYDSCDYYFRVHEEGGSYWLQARSTRENVAYTCAYYAFEFD